MKTSRFELRCTDEERLAWEQAAAGDGVPVAQWVRRVLSRAASPPQMLFVMDEAADIDGGEVRRLVEEAKLVPAILAPTRHVDLDAAAREQIELAVVCEREACAQLVQGSAAAIRARGK